MTHLVQVHVWHAPPQDFKCVRWLDPKVFSGSDVMLLAKT